MSRLRNFYPGPSKIYPEVGKLYQEAIEQGLFEYNHRSAEFAQIYGHTTTVLKEQLNIPEDYEVFFLSSATECWQVIPQSFVKRNITHIYNGAFGKKWKERSEMLGYKVHAIEFDKNDELLVDQIKTEGNCELIAVTQNETSNGTQVSNTIIEELKVKYPDQLIAVDATSSMGGIKLNWKSGDIWFSSVQKCFGLPAGLSVMVCSQNAINKAKAINAQTYFDNFVKILLNAEKKQTTHTPNIPNIYLLGKVLENQPNIIDTHSALTLRCKNLREKLSEIDGFVPFIQNESVKSDTVLCFETDTYWLKQKSKEAEKHNILIGKGYGELKDISFRIANFPAIPDEDYNVLIDFLKI